MTVRVMVDCESMGLKAGCAILSIGACTFGSPDDKRQVLNLKIDLLSCVLAGLTVDENTARWWREQSADAREAIMTGERLVLREALLSLAAFWYTAKADEIWANGPLADVAWLEAAYAAVGEKAPWSYRQVRDYRTLWSLVGEPLGLEREEPAVRHDALEDAISQARDMESCMARLALSSVDLF